MAATYTTRAQDTTKLKAIVTSNTSNEKDLSKTYDASKSFGTASTEILELVPSTMTPNVGSKTITVKTHTFVNYDGKVAKTDGNPYNVEIDEENWGILGAKNFDGKENEIVIKNNGEYVHYILNEKWKNSILEIREPKITQKTKTIEMAGFVEYRNMRLASSLHKPLIVWNDTCSFLVITEDGISGVVKGITGDVPLLSLFGISKLEGPFFGVTGTKTGKTLVLTFVNTERYVVFTMDENGQITLQMNFK